jgi:hypothetical protein
MNKLLFLLIFISTPSLADELNEFSNGSVADAQAINENFRDLNDRLKTIEEASTGGCSAEQDGSNVIITCSDGTSAVLSSAGTVVTYPQGASPAVDLSTLPAGDLVVVDANDVVLAELREGSTGSYLVELATTGGYALAIIKNDENEQSVTVDIYSQPTIYFSELDCQGQAFVENSSYLMRAPGGGFIANSEATIRIAQVTQSRFINEVCEVFEFADNGLKTVFPYELAQEIVNAAYPARAYQLP